MTAEISRDLGLRIGTHSADHNGSEVPRPRTKNMAHAASSGMDQNIIARLHLMRSMQEILRGHSLQDEPCQLNVIQWQVLWNLDQTYQLGKGAPDYRNRAGEGRCKLVRRRRTP